MTWAVGFALAVATTKQPSPVEARRRLSRSDHKVWRGKLESNASRHSYLYIHIPKAAGASVMHDAPAHLPVGSTLRGSHEKAVFHPYPQSLLNKGARLVVVLRHPVKLAYSQYLMCKHVLRAKSRDFPRRIDDWIATFEDRSRKDMPHFGCYNPVNIQTRFLATGVGQSVPSALAEPNFTQARDTLRRAYFVGIADLYAESLCLLAFRSAGVVKDYCACGRPNNLHHETHGVPAHSIDDLLSLQRRRLARLVALDLALYDLALDRFQADVHMARRRVPNLVCQPTIDDVRRVANVAREDLVGNDFNLTHNRTKRLRHANRTATRTEGRLPPARRPPSPPRLAHAHFAAAKKKKKKMLQGHHHLHRPRPSSTAQSAVVDHPEEPSALTLQDSAGERHRRESDS